MLLSQDDLLNQEDPYRPVLSQEPSAVPWESPQKEGSAGQSGSVVCAQGQEAAELVNGGKSCRISVTCTLWRARQECLKTSELQ